MICIYCGGEIPEGARYCTHCGREVQPSGTQQTDSWQNASVNSSLHSQAGETGGKSKLKYVFIGAGLLAALVVAVGIWAAVIALGKRDQEAKQAAELREEQLRRESREREEERDLEESQEKSEEPEQETGKVWGETEVPVKEEAEGKGSSSGGEKERPYEEPVSPGTEHSEISGENISMTFRSRQEVSGMILTDTMILNAEGDKVYEMKEIVDVDLTAFTDEQYEQVEETYDAMVKQYNSVEGVKCIGKAGDKIYSIIITIDTTGNAVSELVDMGLLAVEGGGDGEGISLSKTEESLSAAGYERIW